MKRFAAFLVCVLAVLSVFAHAQESTVKPVEKKLEAGLVRVYASDRLTLHAYQTNDAMGDQCFAVEAPDNLVAIESPAFAPNIAEWKAYLAGLNKPLTDVLIVAHPNGGAWSGNAKRHATETAKKAITEGATGKLVKTLAGAFGAAFVADVAPVDQLLPLGRSTVGGVDVLVAPDGDGYTIAIPDLDAVYLHMLGADSHSILVSPEHMGAEVAKLEDFKTAKYTLILSSHHAPEGPSDVDAKIAYIKNAKQIAAASADKADFAARMKAAYPTYGGENYLGMTADALFKE